MTHTAQISADFVIFNLWKFTWEKGIDKRKAHNPVKQLNSAIFINITKDLQYIYTTSSQEMHEMLSSYEIAPFHLKYAKIVSP